MKLPFPERIPLASVLYFAGILCVIQLLEGSNGVFSLGCMGFIVISALAFNFAGGFTRPSGSYIFFFSLLAVIFGLCWKAIIREPAESNLEAPDLTIAIYFASICMMFVATIISRRITTKRAILGNLVTDANMQHATVGCLVAGIAIYVASSIFDRGNGSVLSALSQINQFVQMAIILGTIHTIRRSGGTRSINLPVFLGGLFIFANGIFGFSKQGILTPFLCWLMAAASQRYKISRIQICAGLLTAFFIAHYLVPYAQYGRAYREETSAANLDVVISLLSNLGDVRQEYLVSSDDAQQDLIHNYYDTPQGFADRLQMVSMDDAIINYKHQNGFDGINSIILDFENLIPHFIWADKPVFNNGNVFAHEIDLLAADDTSTGISFSPASVSYATLGWAGTFLLLPGLLIILFTLFDSLCGDTRKTPWGLLVAVTFAHIAPEGGIDAIIYSYAYTAVGIVFAAVVGAYVMPVVGTFFIGPEGILLRRGASIRSAPTRLPRPASSEKLTS